MTHAALFHTYLRHYADNAQGKIIAIRSYQGRGTDWSKIDNRAGRWHSQLQNSFK